MNKTIIWKYEKTVNKNLVSKWILTGLFAPCNCHVCLGGVKYSNSYGVISYRVGSSEYYLQCRFSSNSNESYYVSYYTGCPKVDGSIVIGGFEEVFSNLDDFDKEQAIFNLDILK